MKILQINSVCGVRSTGRICTDIARTLKECGHDCKIGYGREVVPEQHRAIAVRIGKRSDELSHALMSRVFDHTGFGSRRATKRFLQWVEEYDPDIVHLHNIHGYYIHIGLLFDYLKKHQKPVVWTLHDCWAFTGHCSYFSRIDCAKWENGGCRTCPQKKRYPKSLFVDRSKKNFVEKCELFTGLNNLTIVTPSKWLADLTRRSFLGQYPVRVIHNGIDLSAFRPMADDALDQYGLRGKIMLLGVASVWDTRKGYLDMLRLSQMLEENEQLVLVGLTDQQVENLPDRIIGITKTNSMEELARIYSAAHVFINPTYEDNYPTVNLEAQACGTPVVTYCTGGSIESVPPENVVPQGDITALLSRAREIACSEKAPLENATAFSAKDRYAEYVELYRQIIETQK